MNTQPSKLDISVEQLRSIYAQFQEILDEKVALHLPQEQDTVKQEVLLQLQHFLVETMEMTSGSLNVVNANSGTSISDLIAQSQQEFVEPFDLELNEQVRQKYQEWEDHAVKVAQLRREAPKKLRVMYEQELESALSSADSAIEALSQQQGIESEEETDVVSELNNEMSMDYRESLVKLAHAQGELPKTRAKAQKVGQLLSYLEGEAGTLPIVDQ